MLKHKRGELGFLLKCFSKFGLEASWRLQLSASHVAAGYTSGYWPPNKSFSARTHFAEGDKGSFNKSGLHASDHAVSKLEGILANEERPSTIDCKQLTAEREEAKALLLQFLKNLGLSTALSTRVAKKGGRFVDHLLSILHTRYHHDYVIGRELTTPEIQGTLRSYLEALAAEHGEGLVDVLVYFPSSPPARAFDLGRNSALPSSGKSSPTRDGLGTSQLTWDGNFRPSVSYALSLGLTLEQVERLAKRTRGFITCKPERNFEPIVSYFLQLGITKPGIVKILLRWPKVFLCSLEQNLKPSILYLESLGIKGSQWPKMLVKFPQLLTYSMTKVDKTVAFLHAAGVSSVDVGIIIGRYPHIVSFSVEKNLEPTLKFLKSMGVNDVPSFLRRSPELLGCSVEGKLQPTIQFLIELGYSQMEVMTIINKFPQILGLAINGNIKPKWDYYAETGWPKSHLVTFPHYFGYSLETRIKPRFALVLRRGIHLTLCRILATSDSEFERRLR